MSKSKSDAGRSKPQANLSIGGSYSFGYGAPGGFPAMQSLPPEQPDAEEKPEQAPQTLATSGMALIGLLFRPVTALIGSKAWLSLVLLTLAPTIAIYTYYANSNSIVLENLEIPAPYVARGMTSEIAADLIRQSLTKAARTAVTTKGFRNVARLPSLPDIDVPGIDMTLPKLFETVFFWLPARGTRVRAWITCREEDCGDGRLTMLLNIVDHSTNGASASTYRRTVSTLETGRRPDLSGTLNFNQPMYDLMNQAAREIFKQVDPYIYSAILNDESRGGVFVQKWEEAFVTASNLASSGHPDAKYAYNLLGLMQRDAGRFELAEENFKAALAIDPQFGLVYHNYGNALYHPAKRYKDAVKAYEQAASTELSDYMRPWSLAFSGDAALRIPIEAAGDSSSGQGDGAASDAHLTFKTKKQRLAYGEKLYREAVERAEAYEAENNNNTRAPHPAKGHALANLALVQSWLGKKDDALKTFANAANTRPAHGRTHLNWGSALLSEGRVRKAEFVLKRALDLYKDNARAVQTKARIRIRLAEANLQQGHFSEAFEHAEQAEKGSPSVRDRKFLNAILTAVAQQIEKPCLARQALALLLKDPNAEIPVLQRVNGEPTPECVGGQLSAAIQ